MNSEKLPQRDWLLLPFLALLTMAGISISTELVARHVLSDNLGPRPGCEVRNDNPYGARMVPNSVCWEKLYEGQVSEFRFNSCGDRAGMECGAKPPNTYRIVMTGTSYAVGRYVARDKTFAALLPANLSAHSGLKIELYNKSMMQGYLDSVGLRFREILAAKPDMILWVVTPLDLRVPTYKPEEYLVPVLPPAAGKPRSLKRVWYLLKTAYDSGSIQDQVRTHFDRTRTALLLRHTLYHSESMYVRTYLMGNDQETGFLKSEFSNEWNRRLEQFDKDTEQNAERARAAGVPLVIVLVPNRAQIAMISAGEWPAGYDPYALGNEMRTIATSHGATYADILPGFHQIPNAEEYFFPVDGHPDNRGHALIADLLTAALTSGAEPAIKLPIARVTLSQGR